MTCKKKLSDDLSVALSDSFAVMAKNKYYYWNCKGGAFYAMHMMFKKHSEDFLEIVDKVAQAIFLNGYSYAKGGFVAMANSTSIKDAKESNDHNVIIEDLIDSYTLLRMSLEKVQLISIEQGDHSVNHVISECIVNVKNICGILELARELKYLYFWVFFQEYIVKTVF